MGGYYTVCIEWLMPENARFRHQLFYINLEISKPLFIMQEHEQLRWEA
jgi:hypothetical protein